MAAVLGVPVLAIISDGGGDSEHIYLFVFRLVDYHTVLQDFGVGHEGHLALSFCDGGAVGNAIF